MYMRTDDHALTSSPPRPLAIGIRRRASFCSLWGYKGVGICESTSKGDMQITSHVKGRQHFITFTVDLIKKDFNRYYIIGVIYFR